jgi:hypothetical protein
VDELTIRLMTVAGILLLAAGGALWARGRRPFHPPIQIAGLDLPPGVVVFTSTRCRRCKDAIAAAKALDVPLREVTYELEADLQERAGVSGVPLTIVIDHSGLLVAQYAGKVRLRTLQRAVARAQL